MGCSNAGWSAVSSAGPMSALAGVLAGFMLNGIVVLLSQTMKDIGKVRALGLLLAAFVALGLDSYLFALVTGDSSCHRAWTEAMLAAGLLGIGTVARVARELRRDVEVARDRDPAACGVAPVEIVATWPEPRR